MIILEINSKLSHTFNDDYYKLFYFNNEIYLKINQKNEKFIEIIDNYNHINVNYKNINQNIHRKLIDCSIRYYTSNWYILFYDMYENISEELKLISFDEYNLRFENNI